MRPPANIVATAPSSRKTPGSASVVAPTIRHQPAEASMALTASITSIWVTGSASAPPSAAGSLSASSPASSSARTAAAASVRPRSDSAALAASTGAMPATASSRGCPTRLQDLDRLGQGDQHEAAAFGGRGVLLVGRRVEVVAADHAVGADREVALEDEDFLAGRMIVGWEARARLEAHERGGFARGLVPAQHLH